MKKTLQLFVLSVPGLGLWQEVLIQYNVHNVADAITADEIVKECVAIGFTPVNDIPATPLGQKSIFLSKPGTGEYGTWTEQEARKNCADVERLFERLDQPYTVLTEWQDTDMTKDPEGTPNAAYN